MKRKLKTLGIMTLALGVCGLAIWQAIRLHNAEVAEQIAKFGFYKQDVYLDFGRKAAKVASIWGAILSGITAGVFLIFAVTEGNEK